MFSGNVFRLLIIFAPLFVFGYWNLVVTRRFLRSVMRAHFPFVGTLFIGLVVALVPASKVGAGPHHLLPFLPWLYWVALSELSHLSADGNQIQGKEGRVLALASSFVLIWLFVPAAERCRRFASEVLAAARAEEAIPGEVRGILHQFRGRNLAMGTAGNDTAHLVLHKWRLVIAGNSYLFEPSAIMDYVYAGFPLSEETIATMTNGSIEGWVIPAGGEPFSMTNLYDFNQKLFPERMLEEFRRNYVIEYSTQHFDVWVYRQRE